MTQGPERRQWDRAGSPSPSSLVRHAPEPRDVRRARARTRPSSLRCRSRGKGRLFPCAPLLRTRTACGDAEGLHTEGSTPASENRFEACGAAGGLAADCVRQPRCGPEYEVMRHMDPDPECRHGLTAITCSLCAGRRRAVEASIVKKAVPPPPGTEATNHTEVWITGSGQCFHTDPACPALMSGQELSARRGRHYSTPEVQRVTPEHAVGTRGMAPCSRCFDLLGRGATTTPKAKRATPRTPNDNFCLRCLRRLQRSELECPSCGSASVDFVQRYEAP